MQKRLFVLTGSSSIRKIKDISKFSKIIVPSDLENKIPTNLMDKVMTLQQYENDLKFNYLGFEEAHNLIEQWKCIPVESVHNKKLAKVLEYKSISILDVLHSNLQIYYLSGIIRNIALVEKIIEYEKPTEICFNNFSDPLSKTFFVVGKSRGIKVKGGIKSGNNKLYFNEILPLLRLIKNCGQIMINKLRKSSFNKSVNENNRPILFISYNCRNLDTALPIYRELEKRGANCLFIQYGMDGFEYLSKNKVKSRFFNEFNNFKINYGSYKTTKKFIKIWRTLSEDHSFQKYFVYNDIDCWEIFSETVQMVFLRETGFVIQTIELSKKILNNLQPNAMVATGDRNALIRSLFSYSKLNNIPTVTIQFGSPIGDAAFWKSPIFSNILCVETKKEKFFLDKIIDNRNKSIVTGQPKFDLWLSKFSNINKSDIFKKYCLDRTQKIILFMSVPYNEPTKLVDASFNKNEYVELLGNICKSFNQLPNYSFIIKPHPNESSVILEEIMKQQLNNNIFLFNKEADPFELICISDLLITSHSTSGLEAVILDKPVITVNLTGRPDLVDYVNKGVAIGVYEEDTLCNAINNALYDEDIRSKLSDNRKIYIKDYLLDGKSSERIADVIENMAKA